MGEMEGVNNPLVQSVYLSLNLQGGEVALPTSKQEIGDAKESIR